MTRDKHKLLKQTTILLFTAFIVFCASGTHAQNIDPDSNGCQYAWAENVGWINFKPLKGPGVTVTDTAVTGMAWGENIGWINLSPTNGNGGVVNDGAGTLSGYAWGENVGWISFSCQNTSTCGTVNYGVFIDPTTGIFSGYAWGENIGWINFSSSQSCLKTAWVQPDTTPGAFSFSDQTGVALNTVITSNTITVSGINAPAPISIAGGEYSVNGGAFTSVAGTVSHGNTVAVRLTSSGNFSTTTNATLTIGGVSDTFSVTTLAIDTTPDAFSFISQTGVALNTVITSNTITVSGINAPAQISIAGGEYSVNGGAFTSVAGTVTNGNTVAVRLTSSGNFSTTTNATLTIGGVSGTFSVTALANKPPVAVCQNVTAVAGSNCTASASIDNGSYDPDGDPITLTQSPAGPYSLGNTSVTLTVSDNKGASSQCTGTVNVTDYTPPTITSASVTPSELWPPNKKMVDVTVNYNSNDNCDSHSTCALSVTCNEPISSSDYTVVDAHHVKLTADRLGSGNGRIYTITITCTDASGNSSGQAVAVTVPHDQGKK
jgi:uncharacterized protein (DUF1330 family)